MFLPIRTTTTITITIAAIRGGGSIRTSLCGSSTTTTKRIGFSLFVFTQVMSFIFGH